ncbi:hypothetical protein LAUMK35_00300 [Mycobacterium pseudokansasii]|nr:hypothetical protein LAUMK35_00300 [Mycobacterium pseudokansasii]VAZ88034.1 hypothetical protein LAUMK21_00299 [Mycobacterium pseudokansasii]
MTADTSSAPAANTPVVGSAAAALAELIAARMPARSVAAAATIAGDAITKAIATISDRGSAEKVGQEFSVTGPGGARGRNEPAPGYAAARPGRQPFP